MPRATQISPSSNVEAHRGTPCIARPEAELLSTGEIKLPNGKIIGHRDYKHIYRQRTRQPDQREAIVINKLALEYRKMRAEENGVVLAQTPGSRAKGALDEQ